MLEINPFEFEGTLCAICVLCLFCALSPLILPTTQEGWCPHFANEELETREVRDLPKGTQLILG